MRRLMIFTLFLPVLVLTLTTTTNAFPFGWGRWYSARPAQSTSRPEVIRPDDLPQLENGVVGWSVNGPQTSSVGDVLAGLPPDDSGKWFVTVFVADNCPGCAQLERDLETDPYLDAFCFTRAGDTGWAHTNVYNWSVPSDRFRFTDFEVTQVPAIFVTPPRNHPLLPNARAFKRTGYDGNGKQLVADMVKSIRSFVDTITARQPGGRRYNYSRYDCLDDCCPLPNPYVQPINPNPYADPWQQLLNFPLEDEDNGGGGDGDYKIPKEMHVVLVIDPSADDETVAAAKQALLTHAGRYPGSVMETITWDDAWDRYGTQLSTLSTPAIVITAGGEVVSVVSRNDVAPPDGDEAYPDYTCATLIVDPQNALEQEATRRAQGVLQVIAEEYGSAKVDVQTFDEATDTYPTIRRTDTPCVVITSQGKLLTVISTSRLLDLADNQDEEGWLFTAIGAGIGVPSVGLIALIVVLVVIYLRRHRAGTSVVDRVGGKMIEELREGIAAVHSLARHSDETRAPSNAVEGRSSMTAPSASSEIPLSPSASPGLRAAEALREVETAKAHQDAAARVRAQVDQQAATILAAEEAKAQDELSRVTKARQALEGSASG